MDCVRDMPTADVAEVVRCKDCKRCYEKRTKRNNQLMRFCMRMDGNEYQVNANDFAVVENQKKEVGRSECISVAFMHDIRRFNRLCNS